MIGRTSGKAVFENTFELIDSTLDLLTVSLHGCCETPTPNIFLHGACHVQSFKIPWVHTHLCLPRVRHQWSMHLDVGGELADRACFKLIEREFDGQCFYRCEELGMKRCVREVRPAPVVSVLVEPKSDSTDMVVNAAYFSGTVVFSQTNSRNSIPTFAALGRAVKNKMVGDKLLTSQQSIRFVLPGGEVPSNRAKVFKKRSRV